MQDWPSDWLGLGVESGHLISHSSLAKRPTSSFPAPAFTTEAISVQVFHCP